MRPRTALGATLVAVLVALGLVYAAPDPQPAGDGAVTGSDGLQVDRERGTIEVPANAGLAGTSATAYSWTVEESPLGNVTGAKVEAVYSSRTAQAEAGEVRLSVRTTETLAEARLPGYGEVVEMRVEEEAFRRTAGGDLRVVVTADEGSLVVDETVDVSVMLFRHGDPDWTVSGFAESLP